MIEITRILRQRLNHENSAPEIKRTAASEQVRCIEQSSFRIAPIQCPSSDAAVLFHAHFYSSSRNTRDFSREIRAQSDTCLHREYNLAMKNKSLRRIAAAQIRRCFAPCAARQERQGVLESSSRNTRDFNHEIRAQRETFF